MNFKDCLKKLLFTCTGIIVGGSSMAATVYYGRNLEEENDINNFNFRLNVATSLWLFIGGGFAFMFSLLFCQQQEEENLQNNNKLYREFFANQAIDIHEVNQEASESNSVQRINSQINNEQIINESTSLLQENTIIDINNGIFYLLTIMDLIVMVWVLIYI